MHDNITIFRLEGNSMRPYLVGGRDKAIVESPAENVRKGDVVVARLCSGETIMHRVVKIEGTNVTLLGDGNIKPEHCHTADIIGKTIGFFRKGNSKAESCSDKRWRVYSFVWTRLLFMRRYLLGAIRLIQTIIIRNKHMKTKEGLVLRNICGEHVLCAENATDEDFNKIINMSESAAELWERVQGADDFTLETLTKTLCELYEIDEQTAKKDASELMRQWYEAGLII